MVRQKSLRKLAEELEISHSYLSMVLSGQRNPNTELRNKLCSLGMLQSDQVTDTFQSLAHNPKVVGSNPTPVYSAL